MRCSRCDGPLTTYTLGGSDDTAVVCESCGYADVPTSHHSDLSPPESWTTVLDRFDDDAQTASRQVTRTENVSFPERSANGSTAIDGRVLEETGVSVASFHRSDDEDRDGADEDESTDTENDITGEENS